MKRKERLALLETIQKYSSGRRPATLKQLSEMTKVPVSTLGRWRKRMYNEKLVDSNRGVNTPFFLYSKKTFSEQPVITAFIEQCTIDKKAPSRYINPLYKICHTLSIGPEELIKERPITEKLFTNFESEWAKLHPNKSTERHAKALRKFCHYNKIDLKDSSAIPGSSQSKGDYATVSLTDAEFTKGLKFFSKEAEFVLLVAFGLFHEIFARPDAMFSWTPNVEKQYIDVNGKSYEYGACSVYEPKQEKYYDKLILDPRISKLVDELNPNKPFISKELRGDMEHILSEALRTLYLELGKIEEGEVYEKGQPGWLYFNRPIYTLRHSAATMWVRRLNFNVNLVASMGWEDPKTLTTFYARTTTSNIMQAGVCYYCKPPQVKTDKAVFCSASHATAYLTDQWGTPHA